MSQQTFSLGTITWKDIYGRSSTTRFKGPLARSIGYINTLRVNLNYTSSCAAPRVGVHLIGINDMELQGDLSTKAILNFSDNEGNNHSWILPGYKGPIARDKFGEYVPFSQLETYIGYIHYFTGNIGLSPLRSPIVRY